MNAVLIFCSQIGIEKLPSLEELSSVIHIIWAGNPTLPISSTLDPVGSACTFLLFGDSISKDNV